jgi:hypothetical protein
MNNILISFTFLILYCFLLIAMQRYNCLRTQNEESIPFLPKEDAFLTYVKVLIF